MMVKARGTGYRDWQPFWVSRDWRELRKEQVLKDGGKAGKTDTGVFYSGWLLVMVWPSHIEFTCGWLMLSFYSLLQDKASGEGPAFLPTCTDTVLFTYCTFPLVWWFMA
jgi:hypothetical protein